jgi:hypothetical protein
VHLDPDYDPDSERHKGEGWWRALAERYHWTKTDKQQQHKQVAHLEAVARSALEFLGVMTALLQLPLGVLLSAYTLFLRSRTDDTGRFLSEDNQGTLTTKPKAPSMEELVAVLALASKTRAYTYAKTQSNRSFLTAGMYAALRLATYSLTNRASIEKAKKKMSFINITKVAKLEVALFNRLQRYLLEPTVLDFISPTHKTRTAVDRETLCATVFDWRFKFPFAPNYAFDEVAAGQSEFEGKVHASPNHHLLRNVDKAYLGCWGETL